MKVNDDSELYAVNNVWLGPKGTTLPFRARYSAYGVGLVIFLIILSVEHRLGMHFSFLSMTVAVMGTLIATRYLMQLVSFERPLKAILAGFWQDLTAPRQETRRLSVQFRTKGILRR